jgi:hypothetical protein
MNTLAEVGRVTPSTPRSSDGLASALGISATEDGCAPSFALKESVVAAIGAQRTARPTLRFRWGAKEGNCIHACLGHLT